MVRTGKVMYVDPKFESGIIRDNRGKEFFFHIEECKEGKLPPLYSIVSFIKDDEFKFTNVACLVQLDQLPRAI